MGVKKLDDYPSAKELLENASEREKVRSTIYVKKSIYENFQRFCKKRGVSTSELLQAMMVDVLREVK